MLGTMRFVLIAVLLAGCSAPPPVEQPKPDVTAEAWYGETVEHLQAAARQAEDLYRKGRPDEAAGVITRAEPDVKRVLEAPHPTLGAMEAASGLDSLYGRMLMANRHYGWARLTFQKNAARWRYWSPRTPESERRLREANEAIAECDRLLAGH
jgi:hypothetical protein